MIAPVNIHFLNFQPRLIHLQSEEDIYHDRRQVCLEVESSVSITVSSETSNPQKTVEAIILQSNPITKDLLERAGWVQVETEAADEGRLIALDGEGDNTAIDGTGASIPKDDDAAHATSETNKERQGPGSWFELVIMSPNSKIPMELLRTQEELGPEELSLAQETKDVLIRVLYGRRYLIKERPRAQPSNDSQNENAVDLQTRRAVNFDSSLASSYADDAATAGSEGERSRQCRWKCHTNPLLSGSPQRVASPMFSKSHELWKHLEVGDVLGVLACTRGERRRSIISNVYLRFWGVRD